MLIGFCLVRIEGGRQPVTPDKAIAIHVVWLYDITWYMSGVYCQLGESILPTGCYQNQKNALKIASMLAYAKEIHSVVFLMFLTRVAWKMFCPGYPSTVYLHIF